MPTSNPMLPTNTTVNWKMYNNIIIAESVIGSVSAVVAFLILLTIVLQKERRQNQSDRLVGGLFLHTFIFSIVNAVPFDYDNYRGVTNADYCWWRGWWFGSSFGFVGYIIFMLGVALFSFYTAGSLPAKGEMLGHFVTNAIFVATILGFMVPCYKDYEGELNVGDDDNGAGAKIVNNTMMQSQFTWLLIFVVTACVMWLGVFRFSFKIEKEWRNMVNMLQYLDNNEQKQKELEEFDGVLIAYGETVRVFRFYPVIFLLFAIPSMAFFSDNCYEDNMCRHSIELVLTLRTLAIVFCFLIEEHNRDELRKLPRIIYGLFSSNKFVTSKPNARLGSWIGESKSTFRAERTPTMNYRMATDGNNLLRPQSMYNPDDEDDDEDDADDEHRYNAVGGEDVRGESDTVALVNTMAKEDKVVYQYARDRGGSDDDGYLDTGGSGLTSDYTLLADD
eukprot:m.184731 g.184731  ORF g.184731 m.184731 type:complete len:447 (-) comp32204_c2_seq1:337-1677(-)